MRSLSVILFVFLIAANAQDKGPKRFVLDETKPYVYIAFDHAGKRKPLGPGESRHGVWLRFVNNCQLPVTIGTFGTGAEDPGIGVLHDVVPIMAGGSGGIPELPGTSRPEAAAKAPEGYSAEVHSLMTVEPGESVLFSVPLNHLTPHWYIRVEFTLEVSKRRGDQPYSYADFRWDRLPDEVRNRGK